MFDEIGKIISDKKFFRREGNWKVNHFYDSYHRTDFGTNPKYVNACFDDDDEANVVRSLVR